MMRRAVHVLAIIVIALASLNLPMSATAAEDGENKPPSAKLTPGHKDYNAAEWANHWSPVTDDVKEHPWAYGLQTGVVIPELYDAFSKDEQKTYNTTWKGNNDGQDEPLVNKVAMYALTMPPGANEDDVGRIKGNWDDEIINDFANQFGASKYEKMSPNMKGVIQRIGVAITGRKAPYMPDEEWAKYKTGVDCTLEENKDKDECKDHEDGKDKDEDEDNKGDSGKDDRENDPNVPEECRHLSGIAGKICDLGGGKVVKVVECSVDAFGCILGHFANSASSMTHWILDKADSATAPSIADKDGKGYDWFIDAYKATFGIGVIVFAIVLLTQFVQLSRNKITADEMQENLTLWTPVYWAGALFAPPLMHFFIAGSSHLTDGVIETLTSSNDIWGQNQEKLNTFLKEASTGELIGSTLGGIIAFGLLALMGFVVFLALSIQDVTVTLGGVFIPLALAWIVNSRTRGGSLKIPTIILTVLLSRPLLFFIIGIGLQVLQYELFTSDGGDDAALTNTGGILVAIIIFTLAAVSPFLLVALVPIMPKGQGAASKAGSFSNPASGFTSGAGGGSGSKTSRMSSSSGSGGGGGVGSGGGRTSPPPGGASGTAGERQTSRSGQAADTNEQSSSGEQSAPRGSVGSSGDQNSGGEPRENAAGRPDGQTASARSVAPQPSKKAKKRLSGASRGAGRVASKVGRGGLVGAGMAARAGRSAARTAAQKTQSTGHQLTAGMADQIKGINDSTEDWQ